MAGEIDLLTQRYLGNVLGVTPTGIAALQGVNRCLNLVALYGDSLIDQAHLDNTNLNRAAFNDFGIANALSGQRAIPVINKALSGTRSDQILQTFLADVASGALQNSGAGTLIFNCGTNDFAAASYTDVVSSTSVTATTVAANVVANAVRIIDTAISLGLQVIFRTVHGASNFSAAQIGQCEIANARFRNLFRPRLWLLEVRDALRDPLATSLTALSFRSGYLKQDSGPVSVHEAVPGAVAVGKKLADILKLAIPPLPQGYSDGAGQYSANQRVQIVQNPHFVIGGGTAGVLGTGGTLGTNPAGGALSAVPDYWQIARLSGDTTSTWTVNVKEDADGRFVEIVVTSGAANGGVRMIGDPANANWDTGDVLQGFSTIEVVSGATNLACACPYLAVSLTTAGVTASTTTTGNFNDNIHGVFSSTEGYVFEDATERMLIPAYDTKNFGTFRAVHILFATAGTATIRVRKPRIDVVQAAPAIAA